MPIHNILECINNFPVVLFDFFIFGIYGITTHETIYDTIYAYPRGELRRQLIALLRQGKSTRRPRSAGQDRRGQIPDMVSIHVRPPEIEDRLTGRLGAALDQDNAPAARGIAYSPSRC